MRHGPVFWVPDSFDPCILLRKSYMTTRCVVLWCFAWQRATFCFYAADIFIILWSVYSGCCSCVLRVLKLRRRYVMSKFSSFYRQYYSFRLVSVRIWRSTSCVQFALPVLLFSYIVLLFHIYDPKSRLQGDHSPDNVKFPDGPPRHSAC